MYKLERHGGFVHNRLLYPSPSIGKLDLHRPTAQSSDHNWYPRTLGSLETLTGLYHWQPGHPYKSPDLLMLENESWE